MTMYIGTDEVLVTLHIGTGEVLVTLHIWTDEGSNYTVHKD